MARNTSRDVPEEKSTPRWSGYLELLYMARNFFLQYWYVFRGGFHEALPFSVITRGCAYYFNLPKERVCNLTNRPHGFQVATSSKLGMKHLTTSWLDIPSTKQEKITRQDDNELETYMSPSMHDDTRTDSRSSLLPGILYFSYIFLILWFFEISISTVSSRIVYQSLFMSNSTSLRVQHTTKC